MRTVDEDSDDYEEEVGKDDEVTDVFGIKEISE